MHTLRRHTSLLVILLTILPGGFLSHSYAAEAEHIEQDARQALQALYAAQPVARDLAGLAEATLVFPDMLKAGLVFGGSYGRGVLLKDSTVVDHYNSVSGSWGLQIGAQTYSYVVFLMTEDALEYIEQTRGWEIGVGPSVVLVDEGIARNLSTSSLQEDAYAFIFGQQGLMAGLTIEGTKITRIDP